MKNKKRRVKGIDKVGNFMLINSKVAELERLNRDIEKGKILRAAYTVRVKQLMKEIRELKKTKGDVR